MDWVVSKENDIIAVGDSVYISSYVERHGLCLEAWD